MCVDYTAQPPAPPVDRPATAGRPVTLTADDGTDLLAWQATATDPTGAAVVVLPDIRGLFPYYQRLAEYFAATGVHALAIDYFGRTAGTGPREPDFDHISHIRQTTFEGVAADITAGVNQLLREPATRAVFTVGFCFGGSYSYLYAAEAPAGLAGVIGFYGGMWARSNGGPTAIERAPQAKVPVLALFGGADESIPPDQIAEFRAGLAAAGVDNQVHVYPGAPHSFFDRTHATHTDECADAWRRMLDFVAAHTPPKFT